jgi:hypothetical protein
MSASTPSDPEELSRDEINSAIFVQMVVQQANLALMLLGRVPHPQTGRTEVDVEAARSFIDQLEMLEAKTKGNLNPQEAAFLKDTLMSVRMAFVEAVEAPAAPAETPSPAAPEKTQAPEAEKAAKPPEGGAPAPEGESRKKFAKKY